MRADRVSKAFGQVLKKQRSAHGLSQEALALEAGVDRTFVGQIERGLHQPSLTTLVKLSAALEVQPSVLIARMERALKLV